MPDRAIHLKSDERGFLYLDYLGKRLMTFRGEEKLILRQRLKQVEEEVANEATKTHTLNGAVFADPKCDVAPYLDEDEGSIVQPMSASCLK